VSISLLALVILGTVIVLTSTSYYLAINDAAYIDPKDFTPLPTTGEVPEYPARPHVNATLPERIPRILHQTWKTETLPVRWRGLSQGCRDMHPD
jgi:mannosyltransferase OCH1-like enzyme